MEADPHAGENGGDSLETLQTISYPFLKRHDDAYLAGKGFALCNMCKVKVKWKSGKAMEDHLKSVKHMKAQQKIALRLDEFGWLELRAGEPRCLPCDADVAWKNLVKLKEHEESLSHQAATTGKSSRCAREDDVVKMEINEEEAFPHSVDLIHIGNRNVAGLLITEELKSLRLESLHSYPKNTSGCCIVVDGFTIMVTHSQTNIFIP